MSKHSYAASSAIVAFALTTFAGSLANAATVADAASLAIPAGTVTETSKTLIAQSRGEQRIAVRLTGQPLAAVAGNKRTGKMWSRSKQQAHLAQLRAAQDALMTQVRALGGTELGRVSKAHNAVVISIDAKKVPDVAKLPGVAGVRRLIDYRHVLDETVPYIGAAAVQAAGVDGSGVRVAVLDSGVDYTHKNLGGPGTVPFYDQCYAGRDAAPVGNCANYFGATAPKVVGGFDFVGETWPNGARTEDPNPIDFEGHGTHVSDIIAGKSADGTHKGVAPGASLYGIKVCSAVASSCNGLALLLGMDFALDPNGDDNIADAVDVINMSLGSSYGQREDDLSAATSNASKLGVVVVVSAGNSADRPFITGSPSTTPEAISVAQTQVPSALTYPLLINAPANIAGTYSNTATLDFAPIGAGVNGTIAYVGRGCPAGSIGAGSPDDPYLANPAGKIALIDRGACSVSLKIDRAAQAGATGVLIGLIAAGDAISFSNGGGTNFVPSLVITQPTSNLIKQNIAAPVVASVSPAATTPLVGSVVGSSSRGPSYSYGAIKPDIGAPGASLSAEVGTGDGELAFGGTSGAAPMVSGAAALVLQEYPTLLPHEVKARLMNSAETLVYTNPATQPGVLAPITRIGGGEVRVDDAIELTTAMWDAADPASVSLSFGALRTTGVQTLRKKVLVRNYTGAARNYAIGTSFRYVNDAASGAVTLSAPATVAVPANGTATFMLTMSLNSNLLPVWPLNNASNGGNGALLNGPEYDGYLTLTENGESLHLPWHILPHKSANVVPAATSLGMGGATGVVLGISNIGGAVAGAVEVFRLNAVSPKLPAAIQPKPGDNFAIIDLKSVGARVASLGGGTFGMQFAINTWGQRSHPAYPAEFDVYIDVNDDGDYDFVAYTVENTAFAATGQTVVALFDLAAGTQVIRFFASAGLSSANMIMTILLSDLGVTLATKLTYQVYAFDNYFTGALTDQTAPMTITPETPRFGSTLGSSFGVPIGFAGDLPIGYDAAGDAASPSDMGLLFMYGDGKTGAEASAITITP